VADTFPALACPPAFLPAYLGFQYAWVVGVKVEGKASTLRLLFVALPSYCVLVEACAFLFWFHVHD
jgi:hypothetical protein